MSPPRCHRIAPTRLTPEEALILAVYRRARQDLIYDMGRWGRDAEKFFRLDGFDPDEIRRTWSGKGLRGGQGIARRSELARERRRLIHEKRDGGALFREIAEDLGITPERVRQIYYAK